MDRDRVGSFEGLKVWQEAHALTLKVFAETPGIPDSLQDALASLLERAAIEVPRNIAEGFARRGAQYKSQYYNAAQSALESLRYLFILCRDLKAGIDTKDLAHRGDLVARMLDGLVRSVQQAEGRGEGQGGRGRRRRRGGRGGGHEPNRPANGGQSREADLPEDDLPQSELPEPDADYADDE